VCIKTGNKDDKLVREEDWVGFFYKLRRINLTTLFQEERKIIGMF